MKSNSAVLIRLYPSKRQEKLLTACCMYRAHYYNALANWWNAMHDVCAKKYRLFCEKETDEAKRREFSKTLLWPPKKCSKEGLNDTCLKVSVSEMPASMRFACEKDFKAVPTTGKARGIEKCYGDVFRLNAVYLPARFGECPVNSSAAAWCKDDFARAINMTFSKGGKGASRMAYQDTRRKMTFKVSMTGLDAKYDGKGRVKSIRVPFLSGKKRKSEGAFEWISCGLSDAQLDRVQSVSAMTVSLRNGKWFGSLSVYAEDKTHVDTGLECGIDLGIKTSATIASNRVGEADSCGDAYEKMDMPVERIKALEKRIEFYQKAQMRRIKTWLRLNKDGEAKGLSMTTARGDKAHNAVFVYRKHYQSSAFKETEKRIARTHERIANIRKDWHEQASRKLADRFDVIGMEDLNVSGMVKNSRLARHVERIGFYNFRMCVQRKAGIDRVIYVDRFAPSSKMCSVCGYKKSDLTLGDREWTCPECGAHHDRDENAASNIRPSRKAETESRMR